MSGEMLDAFCFSGGFGITALKSAAVQSVLAVDSSESALTLAAANAELNGVGDRIQFQKSDVKRALEQMGQVPTTGHHLLQFWRRVDPYFLDL